MRVVVVEGKAGSRPLSLNINGIGHFVLVGVPTPVGDAVYDVLANSSVSFVDVGEQDEPAAVDPEPAAPVPPVVSEPNTGDAGEPIVPPPAIEPVVPPPPAQPATPKKPRSKPAAPQK